MRKGRGKGACVVQGIREEQSEKMQRGEGSDQRMRAVCSHRGTGKSQETVQGLDPTMWLSIFLVAVLLAESPLRRSCWFLAPVQVIQTNKSSSKDFPTFCSIAAMQSCVRKEGGEGAGACVVQGIRNRCRRDL